MILIPYIQTLCMFPIEWLRINIIWFTLMMSAVFSSQSAINVRKCNALDVIVEYIFFIFYFSIIFFVFCVQIKNFVFFFFTFLCLHHLPFSFVISDCLFDARAHLQIVLYRYEVFLCSLLLILCECVLLIFIPNVITSFLQFILLFLS